MLQMFGQMMMMPISMATAGMNMMAAPFAGGNRGDGRAGWDASLGRWLGGCCGSREGPRGGGGGQARSLDSRGAGWTTQGGGSGTPRLTSGYRSGNDSRPSGGGYRSGTESQPGAGGYRSGTESQSGAGGYRSGTESQSSAGGDRSGGHRSGSASRQNVGYRSGNEARSGSGSGSRSGDCGCGKRSGGGGCGCGSERTRSHDHYREERRMSSCSCCEDRHTIVRLVEYWVVNVRHCNPQPYQRDGHGYQAYTEEFDECGLETWLLGQWASEHHVPKEEQKYLRIKVNHIGEWHTVDDCCDNREVTVLRDINETLKSYLRTIGPQQGGQPQQQAAS